MTYQQFVIEVSLFGLLIFLIGVGTGVALVVFL